MSKNALAGPKKINRPGNSHMPHEREAQKSYSIRFTNNCITKCLDKDPYSLN